MIYQLLNELIRKSFYTIFFEKYENQVSNSCLESFVCRHPMVKPKLVVVNDEVVGFEPVEYVYKRLEKYSIYVVI